MKFNKLFYAFVVTLISVVQVFAQIPPDPGGGTGGVGTGSVSSPIDMYVYILAIAAILFIVLYAKKLQRKQTV